MLVKTKKLCTRNVCPKMFIYRAKIIIVALWNGLGGRVSIHLPVDGWVGERSRQIFKLKVFPLGRVWQYQIIIHGMNIKFTL